MELYEPKTKSESIRVQNMLVHLNIPYRTIINDAISYETELTLAAPDLLEACEALIQANQEAVRVSFRNEAHRGMIWNSTRSNLNAARLNAELTIKKARGV